MDAEFEDDDTYGGDQLIPGAARSNLRNAGAKDDASIISSSSNSASMNHTGIPRRLIGILLQFSRYFNRNSKRNSRIWKNIKERKT